MQFANSGGVHRVKWMGAVKHSVRQGERLNRRPCDRLGRTRLDIYTRAAPEYDKHMRRIFPITIVTLLTLATAAMAQAPVPADKMAPDDNSWKNLAAVVLFAGFVIAVSIKNAKRDHRD